MRALRQRIPKLVDAAGLRGARVALAGDTAISEETVTESRQDFARIGPAALVITFVLLALLLRALVAPLYLVTASVLALMASLGLTVYLFQDVAGHAEIVFFVPFVAAVLLIALGSDYKCSSRGASGPRHWIDRCARR